jgi:hypothetical protein
MILLSLRCKKWPKGPNYFIFEKAFQKMATGKPVGNPRKVISSLKSLN